MAPRFALFYTSRTVEECAVSSKMLLLTADWAASTHGPGIAFGSGDSRYTHIFSLTQNPVLSRLGKDLPYSGETEDFQGDHIGRSPVTRITDRRESVERGRGEAYRSFGRRDEGTRRLDWR